ncbi:transcription factor grauzone isoform X2 [Aedes aegypti]|uniref:C2H2-type domain-containing protein n=1 Tax=Aedes aegypti TaxID=7159 RepID=A0A6I8U2W4_AEDAE|nr:transcription factor grauzone isoform X2 [Aedes aegypti]
MDIEVEFLEANVCVVCLAENPNLLEVQFDERQVPTIGPILVKHLWFEPEELHYKHICEECWNQVNQFHIFYSSMQKAHSNLKSSIETVDIVESFKAEPSSYTPEFHDTYLVEVEQPQSIDLKQEENENLPLQKETNAHNSQEKHDEHKEMEEEEVEHEDDYEEEGHSDYEPNESKTGSESSDSDTEKAKEIPKKVRKKQTTGKVSKTAERNYNKSIEQIEEEDKKISDHCKLQCAECETTFPRFSDYKQHARKAHQIAHPVVICCDRRFNKRIKLLEHATKRMNPDAFRCTLCEKSYCNSLNLRLHMLRHNPPDAMKHKCDQCDRSFAKRYQLTAHQQTHVPEDERKFICSTCNKSFVTKYAMQQHVNRVHLKQFHFTCDTCAKSFYCKQALQVHQRTHDEILPSEKIQCAECGSWHKHMLGLMKHRKRHHQQEQKQYPCPDCGKVTRSLPALRSHQSYNHKMESIHKCTICEKAFKRAKDFRDHMAVHTGMPLHKCNYCDRQFNSAANMFSHRKREHRLQWEADQKLNIKSE